MDIFGNAIVGIQQSEEQLRTNLNEKSNELIGRLEGIIAQQRDLIQGQKELIDMQEERIKQFEKVFFTEEKSEVKGEENVAVNI